jgi:uncharacterized protein (TIGR00369 family)
MVEGITKGGIHRMDDKKQLFQQLVDQLQQFDVAELKVVQHAMVSLNASSEGGLHYFGRFLGIEWGEDGEACMHLGPQNANTYGVAQGGALYTFADIAIGYLILEGLGPQQKVYTLELKMNYIKKGEGKRVIAKPQILHKGRYTVVADCRIEDEQGVLVAHAMGTFFLDKGKENNREGE